MAQVHIDGDALVVEIEGLDKLWALKSRLEIPLVNVRGATADPGVIKEPKGIRCARHARARASSPPAPSTSTASGSSGTSTTRPGPSSSSCATSATPGSSSKSPTPCDHRRPHRTRHRPVDHLIRRAGSRGYAVRMSERIFGIRVADDFTGAGAHRRRSTFGTDPGPRLCCLLAASLPPDAPRVLIASVRRGCSTSSGQGPGSRDPGPCPLLIGQPQQPAVRR